MHLRADNTCAIYEVRPEICRIRGRFEENAQACNAMQAQDNMEARFRVKLC